MSSSKNELVPARYWLVPQDFCMMSFMNPDTPKSNHLSFSTLRVSGPDAASFLQGQLTCDVAQVKATPSFGAYCDPRGRMIANFLIERQADAFILTLPESMLPPLFKQLKKFILFSKVALETQNTINNEAYPAHKLYWIRKKVVFVYPETALLWLPQMIHWEQHGGVSFTKGCYVGQEIIARTQHLGKLKRHLHELKSYDTQTALTAGTELYNPQQELVGVIGDSAVENNTLYALAVLQDGTDTNALLANGTLLVKC